MDWQLSLPASRVQQWLTKILLAFLLTLLAGFAAWGFDHLLYERLTLVNSNVFVGDRSLEESLMFPIFLVSFAIYASSVQERTYKATILGIGLTALSVGFMMAASGFFMWLERNGLNLQFFDFPSWAPSPTVRKLVELAIPVTFFSSLAYRNFRLERPSVSGLSTQLASWAGILAIVVYLNIA